ncbi:hypothetical protein HRbin40_00928 [bacterium HR40]|nr:hypothetical protein HRbin40_00928 [bacterium HR40]
MDTVRVVSLVALRRDLAELLQPHPLLRLRFERALAKRDGKLLDDAFRTLALYPQSLREAIEDAICRWLFGGRLLSRDSVGGHDRTGVAGS